MSTRRIARNIAISVVIMVCFVILAPIISTHVTPTVYELVETGIKEIDNTGRNMTPDGTTQIWYNRADATEISESVSSTNPDKPKFGKSTAGSIGRIVDGDTLDINGQRIRLALVNTPERGEAGYEEAKIYLNAKCPVGSTAIYDPDDTQKPSYGRIVAKVWCVHSTSEISVNEMLVLSGHAQILDSFCKQSEFGRESWARSSGC